MLSKNNYQEKIRKMENKKERFSIRKFSVGAASVLIGFTIFGLGAGSKSVKADTLNPNQVNVTNTAKASKEAPGLVKNQTNNQNITLDTNRTAETTNVQKKEVVSDNKVQTNKNESVKQTTNTNAVAKTAATKQVKSTVQTNSITQAQNTSNNQEQSVSDYSQFINALQDANVNTIKLNQNIDFSNTNLSNNTYQTINNYGSARQVTIDGQNQYGLDMGNRYISLGDNTHYDQGASTASHSWNVVLKDLSLQTVSGYGPFWFKNSAANNDAITFNGVTTSQDSGQLLNNKGTNVNFEGKNNLQGNLTSSNTTGNALIQANNVNFLNGSTTLAANNSTSNNLSNINVSGNVVVSNGTTVDFNSANTSNMAGITIPNGAGAGNQTIDNATSGVVRLMPNAKVTMELGSGSSMGIMNASDLDLQENSSLKVTTSKMNTTGWRSAALIGLDYDGKTADSTVRVGQNALLSIIRTKVTDSDSPLLAMGPKDGLGATYHLDVNGGSLDLEDSSYSSYLPDTYTLTKGSYRNGWPAILTMWGSSSQNYINFTNAKLVNLQRTAANKPGYLIKTDGAGDVANQQTHIVINSADSNYNTPLTMVPAGASDPVTWNIKYLNNTSQGGDFAYAFRSHKQYGAWNQPGSEYMIDSVNADTPAKGVNEVILTANPSETGSNSFSDGSVVPEGTETAASNALNSFINHFSWWNASGVKFGSELQTNNQYTPSYKPVSVEQGKTATTDPTFTNKIGEVITTPDGTHFAGTEATPTWSKIDPSTGRVTLTPTTSTTPGAYNIPVTITYADGSKQNANVPVVVTKGTQTVIWNNDNATVVTISRANANAHETSDNSQVISASGMITSVQSYSIDQNHQIATTPTTITNYTADWENTPNTVVETATAAGKNIANNVIDITIDGKTDKTNPFDIDAKGAGAKTLAEPIDILAGSDLTSSQFKALVQNNIPDSEIQSTAWQTKPVQDQGGVIRITFNDKDAQGQNTYLDINIPASSINVTTEEKDSEKYHITYPHLNVERPDSGQNTGSVNPTIPADMPNDEVSNYRIGTFTAPTGVTVDVDQTTGKVTETVDSNAQLGSFNVPVVVTFKDGSSKIVNAYNNWLNNYFNFYGATTGSTLNFKQNSNISDLTQEQYRTLINVNSLGREGWNGQNTNSNAPEVLAYIPGTDNSKLFSMSWAPNEMPSTKEVANNVPGTVRIMFNDGTYLDVKANINVEKDGNSGKPDDQKTSFNQQVSYQYDGKEVAAYTIGNIAKGSSLSAEQLKNIINSNLPANYSIVDGYSYPAAESNITSQPAVLVVPVTQSKQQHDDSDYNATVIVKYIDAETNTPMQTKNGKDKLTFNFNKNQGLKASTLKADIDSEVPTNWKVDPSFVYPVDQTTDNTIIVPLVHGTKDITPTTPGVDPTDPKYKGMFTSVSRKIYQTKPGKAEQLIATQTVNFGRNGVEDLVTGEVTGTGAWEVGKIENNKFVLGGEAEYPTAAVEQISGYDSYVNGTKATEIQSASAIENGKPVDGEAVHITYQQSETPVADVTVSYQFYDTVDKKNVGNPIVVSGKPGVNVKTNLTIPAGYKLAAGQTLPENVVIPAKNEAVVINLVHETKDITPTTPGVNPTDHKYKDMFTSVNRDIYQTKPGKAEQLIATQAVNFGRNGVEDLVTGEVTGTGAWEVGKIENNKFVLGGEAEYPAAAVEQISSYDSYVNGTKATEIQSASAIENGTPVNGQAVHITYQKSNTVTPTPYDPNNKDMNKDVVRGGEGENVEADTPWTVGVKDGNTWKSTGATEGTWPEYNVPQVTDYTSTVDGKDAKVVLADKNVNANTPNTNVVVAYTKTTTPTDADKYTPEGQDVHTTPGVVPPAEKGIKNKDDMPSGTKYTWEKTPDVTKPGKTTGTVIVTYPDGSKDKVDVPVIIDNPTTPSDADKYTPEGQDVHTTPGVVPPAEKGIKNKDDMPDGTKYTWEKTPDVTNPGTSTGTIIVTYPDGSQDKVDVHVVVDKTPSDADKYTPEGQDVHTTPGVVPPAEKGIKNKDDMPSGTKYTWEKTPDVTKPGKTTGTVIVTYPDGSKDKVNVTVIIGTNHVTPEPQPIHTTPGVVPNPSEGIKNKNDMPEGTKYTWKEVPNVSTIGEHTGVVTVTYPDGSSVDVTVKVYVDATGISDNNGGKTTETNSETNTAKAATVNENHHAEKNTLPQTGAKSENTAGILGLAIAAVGSLFGLGVDRKKRQK